MILGLERILIGGGVVVAVLGALQGVTGRYMWSFARMGAPASRRTGWIAAGAGALAFGAGALIQRKFG